MGGPPDPLTVSCILMSLDFLSLGLAPELDSKSERRGSSSLEVFKGFLGSSLTHVLVGGGSWCFWGLLDLSSDDNVVLLLVRSFLAAVLEVLSITLTKPLSDVFSAKIKVSLLSSPASLVTAMEVLGNFSFFSSVFFTIDPFSDFLIFYNHLCLNTNTNCFVNVSHLILQCVLFDEIS